MEITEALYITITFLVLSVVFFLGYIFLTGQTFTQGVGQLFGFALIAVFVVYFSRIIQLGYARDTKRK